MSALSAHLARLSWRTIVLAVLTVGSFFVIALENRTYAVQPMRGELTVQDSYGMTPSAPPMVEMGEMPAADYMPYPYPYPQPIVAATNSRELLKVQYGASMRTTNVPNLVRRVEMTIHGHKGRIDSESTSSEAGYVSFVVPMSAYAEFRTELEALVYERFLSVQINSTNMLPQQQSIEEQQKYADDNLAQQKKNRQRIIDRHTNAVAQFKTQINELKLEIAALRAQPQTSDIQIEIQSLTEQVSSITESLIYENTSYVSQLGDADANIESAQELQDALKKQDKTLIEDVATVNGSVSIQRITYWEIVKLYLPGYWIPFIFAVLTLLSYLWDRRRFGIVS